MQIPGMPTAVLLALAAGVVITVEVARDRRLAEAEARAARSALTADSLQAAADTTRHIYIKAAGLGDSLQVVARRAVQQTQRADKIDRALRMERVVRDQLRATIARLRSEVRSDTVFVDASSGERRSVFDVRQAPYTVHAEVALPAAPARGRMDVRVVLDTLALELRVGCGGAATDAVRPATANVIAPAWANVRLNKVEQAMFVCAAPGAGEQRSVSLFRQALRRFGVSAGYGAVRTSSGSVIGGPGVTAGFRVWP